ncbi:alpha/beta fold hydrolase [Kitasatospora griseola]|uniref:alpha/beta fold hydrolase n=1 Tax=Kitasatospora griseola TaxID=2064 RepID=UPI00364DF78D
MTRRAGLDETWRAVATITRTGRNACAAGTGGAGTGGGQELLLKVSLRALPGNSAAGQDYNIPPKAEQWMADRAHAKTVTIDNASHAVAVSHPAAVADLILRAARDTR